MSHGCHGKEVDRRTHQSHALKDRTAQGLQQADVLKEVRDVLVRKTTEAAGHVIEDQLDAITHYLAATTLSNVSLSPEPPILPRSSSQGRTHRVLKRLSEIEASVNILDAEVTMELYRSELPSFLNSKSFPLASLIDKCILLDADLVKITSKSAAVTAALDTIKNQLDVIARKLQAAKKAWKEMQEVTCSPGLTSTPQYPTDHFFKPLLSATDPLIQLCTFLVLICQVLLGNSRRGCSFIYAMLRYIVQLCLMRGHTGLSERDLKLLSDFPVDPRTAEKEFNLNTKATIYAICPNEKCHASYKPTFDDGSPIPIYPSFCTHFHFGRPCEEPLVRPRLISDHVVSVPIKTFVAFDVKDWIGRLLAQEGLEAKMDAAWTACNNVEDEMHDIFDGDMLRNFKGPDGHYFSNSDGEGRYVFSLSLDFFNPLGNKQAGKKVSVGLISLVCLNLPPELRYKVEYMFLAGIIPGPCEPSLDKGNHYIRPIVDDFVELWNPGVWFSRTAGRPHGRLARCAIVCVVCDLLAAKKAAGFGSLAHTHFCHICHCMRNTHGYGHLDQHLWRTRTNEETRVSAQAYKDSTSEVESDAIFAQTGIRWSELLRLPYFDPTRFVVVDVMHNLFLGLINKHFQDILGIRLEKDLDQEAPAIDLAFSDRWTQLDNEDRKHVSRLIKYLSQPLNDDLKTEIGMALWLKRLSSLRLSALELACSELQNRGCKPIPANSRKTSRLTRADYSRGILEWVHFFSSVNTQYYLPTWP